MYFVHCNSYKIMAQEGAFKVGRVPSLYSDGLWSGDFMNSGFTMCYDQIIT